MFLRRILVPTDFSWRSRRALAWALGFSDGRFAIDLLFVAPTSGLLGGDADAEEQLALFAAQAVGDRGQVRTLLEHGDPAATIVRVAVERSADLIVIGTHARTGVSEALLGSVAHRVITCAPCPVVTLRGDEPSSELRAQG